jgi:hypothetical protein
VCVTLQDGRRFVEAYPAVSCDTSEYTSIRCAQARKPAGWRAEVRMAAPFRTIAILAMLLYVFAIPGLLLARMVVAYNDGVLHVAASHGCVRNAEAKIIRPRCLM